MLAASTILRNDFDADDDVLRIVAVSAGNVGTAELDADGNIRFTSAAGFFGPATLTYTVSDGRNGFDTAQIELRVRPVATAFDDTGFSVAEDGSLVIRVERLLSNDLDGDRMIVGQVFDAIGGSVSLSSDGNILFTPNADFNGQAQFSYAGNTPEGGRAEARVLITVTPVNDAPIARNDTAPTVPEGTSFTVDPLVLLANDSDIDGDPVRLLSVSDNGNVQVSIGEDGLITVTPREFYWGPAYFDYTVTDGRGGTATARLNFMLSPVNDPPEAQDDRITLTQGGEPILEDNPNVIAPEQLLGNDIERDGDPLTIIAVRQGEGGRARLLDNGTILFEPFANFNGDAWFEYRIDDGQGGTDWARATLAYQAVNDRPEARDDSYTDDELPVLRGFEDVPLEFSILELLKNDFDVEGFAVRFESAGNAVNGDIEITDRGTIIFTPDADFWGEATFSYLVSDPEGLVDGGIVTLFFENVGDGPPVAARDSIVVFEDIPTVIPIAALLANDTDIDRDPLDFLAWFTLRQDGPLNGTLEYNADGDLLFTPFQDATRSGGFRYRVTDNADGIAEGKVDIIFVPSNDDPTVGEDFGFVTQRDVPLVIRVSDLLANDFDIEEVDTDGDGRRDVDLDDPDRPFPTFIGVDAIYDAARLQLGERVSVGSFEVVNWAGEAFVVARFAPGFTGDFVIEYRIADREGAEDVGFAHATVADIYTGLINGTPLVDYIEGTAAADEVRGGNRDDRIITFAGNDLILAGDGDDFVEAGDGDDVIDGGDGADRIDGGAGFDTVTFAGSDVGLRADLESRVGQSGFAQGDVYIAIEALIGSDWNDQLFGNALGNRLDGGAGNDIIDGRDGDDVLIGGEGDDIITGGAGADIIEGGAGNDTASYAFEAEGVSISLAAGTASGGNATGDVLTGIENLIGTDADDVLEGGAGANTLRGGRGNDILIGGAGDDRLVGGQGADQLEGGEGIDIADYSQSANGVTIDMADGSAGGGDALGDTFSGIEIIEASFHDDIIRGDAGDNRIRGGRGADLIDGRGGFDTADYSRADEGVHVDLAQGLGLSGEALGDVLIGIEKLLGSNYDDRFVGSTGDDVFDGGFGTDLLEGGLGSDQYLFGFDSGADTIAELGDAADFDRLVIDAGLGPKDVSVLRQGDDLFLEFERGDGFLIDTVRVTDHFLGRETGIEEIVFADGTVWDRDTIETLQRVGRFNAADDLVRFAREDEPILIDPSFLIENDAEDVSDLVFVGIDRSILGTASVREDGLIEFLGAPNHNGDAFFFYTVRDAFGRESTARVEVNLAPVNDAPTAVDDPLVFAVEDNILRIRIDTLLANDFDIDGDALAERLTISALAPLTNLAGDSIDTYKSRDYRFAASNMSGSIEGDYLEFQLRPDFFGAAGFTYTLRDADGATSTAVVEVFIAPVNDAPRAQDDVRRIRLSEGATVSVADLLANSFDIEGDAITFVGLFGGADENPASNGSIALDVATGNFVFTAAGLGAAFIEYEVIDERGAASVLRYNLFVRPDNDPPRASGDFGLRTLEDQVLVIDPAALLANDRDENGDVLFIESIARFADNGKVRFNAEGMIEFAPRADFNGSAGFLYTISDGRGGTSSAYVSITVLPRNEGAILRNDLVSGLEDGPQFVIPAEAFGNDIEPEGDVLFFKSAGILGALAYRFVSADFTVDAEVPEGLSFDPATMRFSGELPDGANSAVVRVWVSDPANGSVFHRDITVRAIDIDEQRSLRAAILDGYSVREDHATRFEFTASDLDAETSVTATLADGSALPTWLTFDPATLTFAGVAPEGVTDQIDITLTFTRTGAGGQPLAWSDSIALDPEALAAAAVAYDSDLGLFDLAGMQVSAQLNGGRPLPDWLAFDTATRTVSLSGFEPDADAPVARLQIVFTPAPRPEVPGRVAASDRGFTLEFVIDPAEGIDPAINTLLAGDPFWADLGKFALDLGGAGALTATRESGAPLNDWLSFDPASMTFSGSPPPEWVGAVPVRINVAGNGTNIPAMSVITEVVVDDFAELSSFNGGLTVRDERLTLSSPSDFNGTVVLSYTTTDEKGGVSEEPALIFFNVRPTRERPDALTDVFALNEDTSLRFAISDLLANDLDRDRDSIRLTAIAAPPSGNLLIELARVNIDPPAELPQAEGAVWSATLADGSALPGWLTIDAATGTISGEIPLDVLADMSITITRTLGEEIVRATVAQRFDGNAGAFATYTPGLGFSGEASLTYTVTDDREGASTGTVRFDVLPQFDPPTARTDQLLAVEDTILVIDPATLLANDSDVDGDPIRFLSVANGVNGTVSFDGEFITFTPTANFSGRARFEYLVTDDRHGVSIGLVELDVTSTNQAPLAATDRFAATEDLPFEFSIADLLANDSDPDGDTFRFQSISRTATGGRILELPGGRWQFVPDENVTGEVGFSYVISDGRRTHTGAIIFDIAPVNDAPIANDDGIFTTDADTPLVIDFAALIANDRDVEGDAFQVVEVFDGDQGFVVRDGNTAIFTPDGGYFGDAGFHYRVTDANGASSVGYVNILVFPEFPLPIASSDAGLEMLEDTSIIIDPALLMANDTAPDGTTLEFVELVGAVRQDDGTYRFTPAADFFGSVVLRYAIQNEQEFPVWSTVTINVLPVEDAPVARDDRLMMVEDEPLTIFKSALTSNDFDVDRQAIIIQSIGDTSGVTVRDLGNGQLEIIPDAEFGGEAWFDYVLTDSTGRTDTARVSVTIAPANDAPVIAAIPVLRGREDTPFESVLPSGVASDADGDVLLLTLRTRGGGDLPAWLVFDASTRTITGNPPADFNGTVELELAAFDGIVETIRDVIVSIEPVNDAPVVGSGLDDVATLEDTPASFVLRSDAFNDIDGQPLTLSLLLADGSAAPSWVRLMDGVISVIPPRDFHGELALQIVASDGELSVTEPFVLTVAPVNDTPLVAAGLADVTVDEDAIIDVLIPADAFADVDGDALQLAATLGDGAALPDWLTFDGARFTGTPPADFNGELALTVTASDGEFAVSESFLLRIRAVNDAPAVLVPLADIAATEDTAFSVALPLDGISDIDGDALEFTVLLADGGALPDWLRFDGSRLEGTPPADFSGVISLQLRASDGSASVSDAFDLVIAAVNDAPVVGIAQPNRRTAEDRAFAFMIDPASFVDVDGDALVLTAQLADGTPLPDWITFDGATLSGTPPRDFNGSLSLAITASDGSSAVTSSFVFVIDPVNDAPVLLQPIEDQSTAEDTAFAFTLPTGTFDDVDSNPLTLVATLSDGAALPAWLTFDGATFSGTPPQNFVGALTLRVTGSDGEFSVADEFTLSVTPVNDAPIFFSGFANRRFAEDSEVAIDLDAANAFDVDGDALTLAVTLADGRALPDWLVFDGARLIGLPPQNFNGGLDLAVTASDGELSATELFRLTIDPVNDAPVVLSPLADVISPEDASFAIAIPLGTFGDIDGDSLTLSAKLGNGADLFDWLRLEGTTITGTPPQDFNGAIDIVVTASDGLLAASDTFRLTIAPVNDAPVVLLPLADLVFDEDAAFEVGGLTAGFEDIDGDALTFTLTGAGGAALPTWLSFANGRLIASAPANLNGVFDLELTASDGSFAVTDAFTLTLRAVNDAPVVVAALPDVSANEGEAFAFTINPAAFADADGDTLLLSAGLVGGAALPSWLAFDGTTLTGRSPANFSGTFDIEIRASDGQASVGSAFALAILPVNEAPMIVQPLADQTATGGGQVTITIPATAFTDPDGDTLAYTARLADGSALPQWLAFDAATRTFTGTAPNANASLDIRVTATDGAAAVSDDFLLTVAAQQTSGGSTAGFRQVNVNSWYNPAWGGGYIATFEYQVQPEAIVDGRLRAWDILAAYTGPGTITGGWVSGFPGAATFQLTPEGARFTNTGQSYQPTLAEGSRFQIAIQVDGAPFNPGDFGLTIFDRDPAFNLADDSDTLLTVAPTSVWNGGLSQSMTLRNTSAVALDGWQVVLDVPDGVTMNITSVWGASATRLADGNIMFRALSSNETVGAGAQTSFGFNASYTGVSTLPLSRSLFSFSDGDTRQFDAVIASLTGSGVASNWRYGTTADDALITTSTAATRIFGGLGNDTLTGNNGADWIAGGSGDDTLSGLGGDDQFWGGAGNDLIYGGAGIDTLRLFGVRSSYSIVTQAGTLGVRVGDLAAIAHGDDGIDQLSSIERLMFRGGETISIASPIILDLDGDGVRTVSAATSDARFDLDGDGLADDTSWISAGDAFLYLDRDGNGTMSGVEEISFVDDIPNAATDLAGLAAFDTNNDRVLDARDARFADFGVWRDADGDGAVDEGETASLAAVGIRSINLVGTPVNNVTEFGEVAIANTGTFTLTNGTTRSFADAALTYFSAATNLPSLAATAYDFDRKASKFRISAAGGALTVTPRRAQNGRDPLAGQLGANTVLTFGSKTYGMFAPVVLDLDGDGIELVSRKKSRASFDYAGDGAADDTGWIGRDDGFLVIDRNNDGLITEAAELSLASEDEEARSGLQGLARLDSNGDGVVDSNDARFGELRVWRDSNGNGRSDAGELLTLEQAGVVAIRLNAVTPTQNTVKLDRNIIAATASFVRTNGTTSTVADVSLAYRPVSAPTAPVAAFDLAERFADFGPDLFLAPREIELQSRFDFLPSVNELATMLGRADAADVTDIFDRVSAAAAPAAASFAQQVTVASQVPQASPLPPRVFDPSSLYFMMHDLMVRVASLGGNGDFADAEAPAVAAAQVGQMADLPQPIEDALAAPVAPIAAEDAEPISPAPVPDAIAPVPFETQQWLNPSGQEFWGGPAWIGSLPAPEESSEAAAPSVVALPAASSHLSDAQNEVTLAEPALAEVIDPPEALTDAEVATAPPTAAQEDRPRLDPAQHELWGGPLRVTFIPSPDDDEGAEPTVEASASGSLHGPVDAEIARKLAMIRQDLSTFGATSVGEIERLRQLPVQAMDIFA